MRQVPFLCLFGHTVAHDVLYTESLQAEMFQCTLFNDDECSSGFFTAE